ncbi:MAG: TolB-like 6-bladed beta-propeller domain-containing protein [Dysgonamonadaceae bacterium]|jgi:hypothetical protein|nr:TolB-like 6-bladed beta-propeller domain-containing protein [Dysgonamonadaceae bacterium]
MKQIVLFLIILFSFFACVGKEDKYDDEFEVKKDVELYSIEYPDILGTSMQLLMNDSLILINDFRGDSLIHVFDIKNLNLVCKIVAVGNGPNELISPLEIQRTDSNLYIYYRQANILYSIPWSKITEGSTYMKKLFQISSSNHLYPLSDSIFISSGFHQKRYALIEKGEIFKEFGEYPAYWRGEKDIPDEARAMFHQTNFLKHPDKQRLLTYTSHVIEIYDDIFNLDEPLLVKNKLIGKYSYKFTVGNILSADKEVDIERGIVYVACSHDYIYVVYDPNKYEAEGKGSTILVYDWSGNPIELLLFNKTISCLVIAEEEMKGYVIAEDPDDSLMYFNLNQ